MTVKTYDFDAQLAVGEQYEQYLDTLFGQWYAITRATPDEQRRGIDRIFRHRDGSVFLIEYKADMIAGQTGKAFVETVSVDTADRPGWAYSSQAQILVYLVVNPQTVYCLPMKRLRACLPGWAAEFPVVQADNRRYRTHGLLVPLDRFERIAMLVI